MNQELLSLSPRYTGEIFDSHVHIREIPDIEGMMQYADKYNITKMLGIMWEDKKKEISQHFPDKFIFARFVSFQGLLEGKRQETLQHIDQIYEQEYPVTKLWFAPRWRDYVKENWKIDNNIQDLKLDSPILEPFFERLEDYQYTLLLHVSDPDILYKTKYSDAKIYGTKTSHLDELENLLQKYPKLTIIGAHMAGQPENLDRLDQWLDKYSNLYVDTASAKWMIREFAPQKIKVQKFFQKHSKRILFGTDIVAGRTDREPIPDYYVNRYVSYQALWETKLSKIPLPIPDPDNDNGTYIEGLDLSMEILKRIYWENHKDLFKNQ